MVLFMLFTVRQIATLLEPQRMLRPFTIIAIFNSFSSNIYGFIKISTKIFIVGIRIGKVRVYFRFEQSLETK